MYLWSTERAKELRERRKNQKKCDRCNLLYFKTLVKCPHCSELREYKVKLLIKQRKRERQTIGKYMILGMLAILIALYLINT